MLDLFGIYGFVAVTSFICNLVVLSFGKTGEEDFDSRLKTSALMAILWPVTLVYLGNSLVQDAIEKYIKKSKKGE